MAVREGKWKCEYCGAVNLGRDMKCTSCQAVRGENIEFFLDDDAAEVQDENQLNTARGGADWHCDYCGTDNRAGADKCKQCGAPKDGMKSRQERVNRTAQEEAAPPPPAPKKKSKAGIIAIGIAILVLVIGGLIIIPRLKKTEASLELTAAEWTRTIEVEGQVWNTYEAWQDEVPAGAEELDYRQEVREIEKVQVGTEQVKVGEKDLGNGYFEDVYEDQPVYEERELYDIMVTYRIKEWEVVREEVSKGGLNDQPRWPDVNLRSGEREGSRDESAVLYFIGEFNEDHEGLEQAVYRKATPEEIAGFKNQDEFYAEIRQKSGEIVKFIDE